MKAQREIEAVTKKLVATVGFENVRVKIICEQVGISRKTFYSFYKDKFDVIESIFYNDIFSYSIQLYELLGDVREISITVLEKMYKKYYDDKQFYMNAFKISGDNSLEGCITYYLEAFNLNLLNDKNLTFQEKEYLSYYFAASQVILLKKWIKDGMILTPREIAIIHQKLVNDSFLKNYFPEDL